MTILLRLQFHPVESGIVFGQKFLQTGVEIAVLESGVGSFGNAGGCPNPVFGVGGEVQAGDVDLLPDGHPAGAADPQVTTPVFNPLLPALAVLFADAEHAFFA
jgi:hypothetical protein